MPASRLSDTGAAAAGTTPQRLEEKLSTRITADVERRLRLYVALHAKTIGGTVTAALDRALPSLQELAAELARDATPLQTGVPGPRLTSKEH